MAKQNKNWTLSKWYQKTAYVIGWAWLCLLALGIILGLLGI